MKKHLIALLLSACGFLSAQQPQTQTAPIYSVNAKYTNGVAPGYAPTAGSGLTLNLGGGPANCAGAIVTYAAGTLTMTASSSNYVYLNTAASCAPAVKTTAFSSSDIPIATVVAGASAITSITDDRTMFQQGGGGGISYPPAGIAKSTGSAWGTAAASDIVALFSGTTPCFLKSDGTCASASSNSSGSGYAAPSYPSAASTTLGPTNCYYDSTLNDFTCPGFLAAGSSPPTALGSAHGFAFTESSNAGTPASGVDYCRADSTSHSMLCSYNGSAEAAFGGSAGGTITYTSSATASTSDTGKTVVMNCSSACTYTLPATQPSTTWTISFQTTNANATIVLGSSVTFNGGSTAPVPNPYRLMKIAADSATSTNYVGEAPLSAGSNVTLTPSANALSLAASGSSGSGGGALVNLCMAGALTITNGTCDATRGLITVTSGSSSVKIAGIPSTYNNIHLVMTAKGSSGDAWDSLQFNDDTGTNYAQAAIYNSSSSGVSVTTGNNLSSAGFCGITGSTSSDLGDCILVVPNYTSSTWKRYDSENGYYNSSNLYFETMHWSGEWKSTAAITSINILGSFGSGTITIYGEL